MTQTCTLSWRKPDAPPRLDSSWVEETFSSEREADTRAIERYDADPACSGIYLNGTYLTRSEFASRLALIERRREAVGLELMTQTASGNSAWMASHPDPESRRAYWQVQPESARRHYLDRADRLIAAYEGALA